MANNIPLPSFLSLLFLLLISSSPLPASSALCNKHDKAALLAIKAAFNNAYHFASWTPNTGCCEWYSVECNATTGRVTELFITKDNISGTIPPAIGDLPFLQVLSLHKLPNLVGPIPPQLTQLTKLRFLTISWTNVSGPVPPFLTGFSPLEQLDLSFNNLSGAIPDALGGEHPTLYAIDISRNHLTGSIPGSLLQKSQDAYLILSHNELTGSIPPTFGSVDFTRIDLSRNRLTGDASFLFGRSKKLQLIDLSRNQLEFDLTGVEFPEVNLVSVDLNHNMINGSIPPQIAKANTNLGLFNVSYNRLCGEIPSGARKFDESSFIHNKCLCGVPLPPCN